MTAELRLRLISAAVMIALVGLVLWIGGWTLNLFIGLAGLILLSEYWGLVRRIARRSSERLLWLLCGVAYIGIACLALAILPPVARLVLICAVIAVDSGAYFAGRAIGGPKIAPAISPSKTWAGLGGGMVGAALVLCGALVFLARIRPDLGVLHGVRPDVVPVAALFWVSLLGALIAICAQAGDFLESWLKRRAGVKDSGTIIPGHGGLLDRVDGLMPAAILAGFVYGAGWL